MTFKQLNEKLGGNEVVADWRQHPNGGGWLHKSVTVEATPFIGPDAIVWGNLSGNAQVFGDARVSGNAQVFGDARVFGDAQVFGDARVFGDTWKKSPLFIVGSKHSLSNAKHGYIKIGCKCEPFKWWLGKDALAFAKQSGYTAAEIKEYRAYVKLFMAVGK